MVRLRARGRQQHGTRRFRVRDERLAVVERLRGELPGMVDAHERGTRAAVGFGKRFTCLFAWRGDRSGGLGRRENRAQGAVNGGNA